MIKFNKFLIVFIILCFYTVSSEAQKDSLEVEKLYELGKKYIFINPKDSQLHFEKAVTIINDSILTKNPNSKYFLLKKALMLDRLSNYYRKDLNYILSLNTIQEGLKIKESIGETFTLTDTYRALGRIYYQKKDSIKALQFYNKAMESAKIYNNNEGIVYMLNAYGGYYLIHDKIEKGKGYIQDAYNYADSIGFNTGKAFALNYLSRYERYKKNYNQVIVYAKKELELCRTINDQIGVDRSYKKLGYAYRKLNQPHKAIYYYTKSLELVTELGLENRLANRYLSLSNTYTDLKQHELAFSYYRKYKRQQIKDLNVKSIKEFAELDAKYTYERKKEIDSIQFAQEREMSKTQLELLAKEKRVQFQWIIICSLLIISVMSFLFVRHKQKNKLIKLENELLEKEVEYKEKDLSDFAMNISRNQQWHEHLLQLLGQVKGTKGRAKGANILSLEKEIIERGNIEQTALNFQKRIDTLNNEFYGKLLKQFPELSKTEIKLCSLIKLNLDNNAIAALQNIEVKSIYQSRFRLRKKLHLTSDADLNAFLKRF